MPWEESEKVEERERRQSKSGDHAAEGNSLTRRKFMAVGGGLAGSLIAGSVLAACGGDSGSTTATGGGGGGGGASAAGGETLTIGIPVEPSTIDPTFINNSTDQEFAKNLYSAWLRYGTRTDADGNVVTDTSVIEGDAIESYEVSEDGLTYRFKVREGVRFPETGNPLTADDFIEGAARAMRLGNAGAFPLSVAGFDGAPRGFKKISDTEFEVKANKSTPVALPSLRDNGLGVIDYTELRRHMRGDAEGRRWAARNYNGCGHYRLVSWETGTQLVLEANPDHWGGEPYYKRIIIRIIPSASDRLLLLQNGTIDIARGLDTDALREVQNMDGIKLFRAPSMLQNMFGLTYLRAPFNNPTLRRAIAMAIDYETLVNDVLGGLASVPRSTWPAGSRWFEVPWDITYDPEQARSLLAEAGVSNLRFTCETSDIDSDGQGLAVALQTMLKAIGVTMDIRKQPQAVFQERIFNKEMTAYIVKNGSFVDDPYYHGFLWVASDAILNYTGYRSREVDDLTRQLLQELDEEKRRPMSTRLQEILNHDLPYIPLADAQFVLPVREGIGGIVHEPDDVIGYWHIRPENA